MPAVEHRFTGPPYTIGIEEELMIVDAETLELSNSIETLLEADVREPTGEVKPELMESVLEIATTPAATSPRRAPQLRELRPGSRPPPPSAGWRSARPARIRSRCGRTSGSSRARATAISSRHCASWRARS